MQNSSELSQTKEIVVREGGWASEAVKAIRLPGPPALYLNGLLCYINNFIKMDKSALIEEARQKKYVKLRTIILK